MPRKVDPAVDAYLEALPKPQRAALQRVRKALRRMLPDADEGMSYSLCAFKRKGSPIIGYGARHDACVLAPMSGDVIPAMKAALKGYATTKGLVKFDASDGFPEGLLRKLVDARLAELEAKAAPRKPARKRAPPKEAATKKAATKKASRADPKSARTRAAPATGDVDALLAARKHPLEKEIVALRRVVRAAHPAIRERWKWNAPSFYVDAEGSLDPAKVPMERNLCNVNLHREEEVLLVLVFPLGLPDELPPWLEGSWKDRRTASFRGAAEVRARKKELETLLRAMVARFGP